MIEFPFEIHAVSRFRLMTDITSTSLLLYREHRLNSADLAILGSDTKLAAFRAATDEHYRNHQFWGGMSIVLVLLYFGWFCSTTATYRKFFVAFGAIEIETVLAAIDSYKK